jgi:hypothetical protein
LQPWFKARNEKCHELESVDSPGEVVGVKCPVAVKMRSYTVS